MKRVLLFVLLSTSSLVFSQDDNISTRTFTSFDGLEFDRVLDMTFDDDGFLWLSGRNLDIREIINSDEKLVIQRFDGKNFHTFPLPDSEKDFETVEQIYKRADGKFYLRAHQEGENELYLFDPITTIFEKIKHPFSETPSTSNTSSIFQYDSKDFVMLQIEREIYLYELTENLEFIPLFSFTSTENKFLIGDATIFIPFKDYVIIGDDNFPPKVFRWNGEFIKSIRPEKFKSQRDPNVPKYYVDEVFKEDEKYYLFLYSDPQLYVVDEDKIDFIPVSRNHQISSENLHVYSNAQNQTIILSDNSDVISFDIRGDSSIENIGKFNAPGDVGGIRSASLNPENGLWVSTEKAIHYIEFPSKEVKNYLSDHSIRSIAKWKDQKYIIATETKGWYILDLETNEIIPWPFYEKGIEVELNSSRDIFVENDLIWSSDIANLVQIDPNKQLVEKFRHYPIISLIRPSDSTIVYGTNGYNLMEFNITKKQHSPLLPTDSLFIYDLSLHKDLVVGATDKGVLTYNLKSKDHQFYDSNQFEDPFFLMTDYTEEYGFLLGSRSGKIYNFNPDDHTFTLVYEDNLEAGIATILFNDDDWWINTFNGYVVFNPENKTVTRFSEKDGFSNNEANRYSALNTGDGLLVGSINGLNYFKPADLKPKENNSELVLTKVRNYDSKAEKVADTYDRTKFKNYTALTLPSEYKALQLDFALTNNIIGIDHRYRYKLDDEDWIDLKQENSIRFANLAAGKYNLEIEALDFSGNKIGKSLKVFIDSKNFFYKTPWFFALVFIAIFTWLFWLLQESKLRTKLREGFSERLLQSQEKERTRIAKELHDSVGQQLTLIKRKAQNVSENEISELTNTALEEVRSISRGLYPSVLKQLGLTESVEQLIYDLDEETELFFSSELDVIDPYFNDNQTLNFYRFIQESLNNVLKHSEATNVSLIIRKDNGRIFTEIRDNGKGFDFSDTAKKKSLGLETMKERIRILKGTIHIDSSIGNGTVITTKIPISNG